MMRALSPIKAFKRDQRGSTAVEFAIIAPVFLFMVMGVFDIGHAIFIRSTLDGAIQKAARDAALETGSTSAATIDAELTATVKKVAKNATVTISRQSYYSFNDVDRAETLNDTNNNGICDTGETFIDENDNLTWDSDVGAAGDGGPQDVVQYTVNVSYPALFPFKAFNSPGGKSQKITGYKTMTRPVYDYRQIKTVTVKEPQYKIENTASGYNRVFIGYKVFTRPIVQKIFVRMESYKKPIYQVVDSSYKLASLSTTRTLSATTVMKNQPFGTQEAASQSKNRTCS